MDMNLYKLWEIVNDKGTWHAFQSIGLERAGHNLVIEQQQFKMYNLMIFCMCTLWNNH